MAETLKNYRIEWEDGTVRYLQLDAADAKLWSDQAADRTSPVKAVSPGDPKPDNK